MHASDGPGPVLVPAHPAGTPSSFRSGLPAWIARRTALALLTLLLASILIFVATQLLPGDPAQAILGRDATPQRVRVLDRELGLDRPAVDQYVSWLGGVVHGDFGTSLAARRPVWDLLGERVGNSLTLIGLTALIALPLSLALGVWTAVKRDGRLDRAVLLASLGLTALPEFVIGMFLIILLATTVFSVLPAVSVLAPGESPLSDPTALVLPTLTLVLALVPYLYRLVRASMLDALRSEYVEMARLKGLPESVVVRRHALPNALGPMIQGTAFVLGYILGGEVVVEALFGYPGIGELLVGAVSSRDVPMLQAIVLIMTAAVVLLNLAADLATVYLTPKLRTSSRG